MRIDLKKYLFVGLEEERVRFFEKAQKLGAIHFINTNTTTHTVHESEDLKTVIDAIKVLRGQPWIEQEENTSELDGKNLIRLILEDKKSLEKIEEEIRIIKLEISRIAVFGNFSLEDVKFIETQGKRVIQFYAGKEGIHEKLLEENPNLLFVGEENGLDYLIAVNSEPTRYEGLVEMKIEENLDSLKIRLNKRSIEKSELEDKLKSLARYNHFLHELMVEEINLSQLTQANQTAAPLLQNDLFAVQGWVPVNQIPVVENLCNELSIHMEEIAIEETETIPTYLENKNTAKIGEDVIHIYDTPSNTDKDPSLWVLFGFIIFFSIIIGDAGYGLLYLGLALFLRYKFPKLKGVKKRVLDLFTILSVGCIVWGILAGSIFGVGLNPDNPLRKFSLISFLAEEKAAYHADVKDATYEKWLKEYPQIAGKTDGEEIILNAYEEKEGVKSYPLFSTLSDQVLLELALFIGVLHIMIGMIRYIFRNPSNIGWILFMIGAYLYFPVFLGVPSILNYVFHVPFHEGGEIGLTLIYIGIPLAIVIAIIRIGILGLTEGMNLIQVFGDVLSYLRLYALGLSGSILSATINDMTSYLPFVIAVIFMALGHTVNMALGIMGGVIHGLRLNFLEWYHYSFEGGGKKFKPLELKELE